MLQLYRAPSHVGAPFHCFMLPHMSLAHGWKGCHVTSLRGKGADRDRHISLANIIRIVQRCPQLLLSFAAASATGPADRVGRCFLAKALQRYSSSSQKVRKHMEWILTLCTAADAVTAWQQRGSNANL